MDFTEIIVTLSMNHAKGPAGKKYEEKRNYRVLLTYITNL